MLRFYACDSCSSQGLLRVLCRIQCCLAAKSPWSRKLSGMSSKQQSTALATRFWKGSGSMSGAFGVFSDYFSHDRLRKEQFDYIKSDPKLIPSAIEWLCIQYELGVNPRKASVSRSESGLCQSPLLEIISQVVDRRCPHQMSGEDEIIPDRTTVPTELH